ncbi:MAG: hypothetical protein ABIJ08_05810 [Nanoarchaeota archaeon]
MVKYYKLNHDELINEERKMSFVFLGIIAFFILMIIFMVWVRKHI